MPTVPKFNAEVKESAIPNARVSTDAPLEAFGGGRAAEAANKAFQDVAFNIGEIAIKERNKADDAKVESAYADLIKRKNDLAHNEKTGAFNKKGENALGVIDEYMPLYEKEADDIEKNVLTSDRQREKFKKLREKEGIEFNLQLNKHVGAESYKVETAKTESVIKNLEDDSALNWQEPRRVDRNVEMSVNAMKRNANNNGMPQEWVDQRTSEITSKQYAGVIKTMLDGGNDLHAEQYYNKVKDKITDSETANVVAKSVEAGSVRGKSQLYANDIFTKHKDSMTAAYDEARKIKDPKVQEATIDKIKERFTQKKLAEKEYEETVFKDFTNQIEASKSIDQLVHTPAWQTLDLSSREKLKNYAKTKQEGRDVVTDQNEWYYLYGLATSPDAKEREMFANINLSKDYIDKLSSSDFHGIAKLQGGLRKGDKESLKDLEGFRSNSQVVNDTLRSVGIDPTPKKGTKDATRAALFRRQVDEEVKVIQSQTGKKATNEQVQGIVDRLTKDVVTSKGLFFDTKKKVFEIDIADVPKDHMDRIVKALKNNNKVVSNAEILKVYKARLSK